jgi:hypothetical protein
MSPSKPLIAIASILFFSWGCGEAGLSGDTQNPGAPVGPEGPGLVPAGECGGPLIPRTPGDFGAIALTDSGALFVAGNSNAGNAWQLAEVDFENNQIVPVIEESASWIEQGWIGVEGEKVSIYEFYPRGVIITYDAASETISSGDSTASPQQDAEAVHSHEGHRYRVLVSTSQEDGCGNVCIVQEDALTEETTVVLDDALADFHLHTGAVHFFGEWVYFMSYPHALSTDEGRAFRRMHLESGEVQMVHPLTPGAQNSWIADVVEDPWGNLYWIRQEQMDGDSPWTSSIDHHDIARNETKIDFSTAPTEGARHLRHVEDRLIWTDSAGLHVIDLWEGSGAQTLVDPNGENPSIHFTIRNDRVYFSLSEDGEDQREALVGCVELEVNQPVGS